MFKYLDRGGYSNRALFSAHLESALTELTFPELESPHFSVLLATDAESDASGFAGLLSKLVKGGASWLSCWGPGTGQAPDIVYARGFQDAWHVTTTWHPNDPLSDAIETFLWASAPDMSTHDLCDVGLVISVGTIIAPGELGDCVLAELAA